MLWPSSGQGVAGQAAKSVCDQTEPGPGPRKAIYEGIVIARDQSHEVGFGLVTGGLDFVKDTVGVK